MTLVEFEFLPVDLELDTSAQAMTAHRPGRQKLI